MFSMDKLVDYLFGGLLLAWFLALFGFDNVFIQGMKELFGMSVGKSSYYLVFAAGGILGSIFDKKRI